MSTTITVRLESDLADRLKRAAAKSGLSHGQIVRDQLRKAMCAGPEGKSYMRLAGSVSGPKNLSQRKGFSRQ
jgi:hypothetical protein